MTSKENSAIWGMLLRNGSARTPAGMISSVDTSSPTLSSTGTSMVSGSGSNSGSGEIFGPFSSTTCDAASEDNGGMNISRLTIGSAGSAMCGYGKQNTRRAGQTPASAELVTGSGVNRHTLARRVAQ